MDLQKSIVPLPYQEPSQVLFQMLGFLTSAGQKFADTTDQIVADATNYGPVGTTMALLEAGAKFFSAVHKRLHHSQREEFNILSRLNFEFLPDVYPYQIPNIDSSIFKSDFDGRVDVIPVSDPNIPSAAHRLAMAQMVLQLASQAPPGMYDLRQVHLGILSASNIQNPERYMPAPMQPQPADPITDIQAASQGKPIKAFPEQDHASHIAVKSAFIQDPTLGQNPMMQSVVPVLQANIREHMVLQYAEQMGGLVNMGAEQLQQTNTEITPEIMGELTTAAAQQVLQANQGGANSVQTLEQQSMELERMSLDIKREGMQIEATKDAAELSLKNRELSIKQQEVQLRAASKISDKEDREVDRRIRALKDAGNMQIKKEASIRDQETKLAIEAVRAMLKEREMFMKEREARTQNLAQGGTVDDYSQGVREIDTLLGRLTLDTSEEAMATYEDAPINISRADRYPAGDKIREIAEQTGIPLNAVIQEVRNQQQDNIVGDQAREVLSELGASELLPFIMPETDDDEELRIAIRPSEELEDTKVSLGKTEIISSEDVERKMDKSSLDLVKEFEGFEEKAYDDSVGVRTIGYGTAATSGRAIPDEITEEEASALAQEDLDNLDRQLDDLLQVEVTPGQKEALKSLAYNVGIGAIARSQGLKKLNQGDVEGAAEEFFDEDKGFVKAGGEKLAGLVRRRAAERDVFFS
jgi:lysozyme